MDSELPCGRGSKFYTRGSNRMLVVEVLLYKLQFFHSGSVFTLRIARLNPPQVFYWFGFPGLSYRVFFIFPHYLHDMIYLC